MVMPLISAWGWGQYACRQSCKTAARPSSFPPALPAAPGSTAPSRCTRITSRRAPRLLDDANGAQLRKRCKPDSTVASLQVGETMRASAYIYNTPDEIRSFVEALKECAAEQQGGRQEEEDEGEEAQEGRPGCALA